MANIREFLRKDIQTGSKSGIYSMVPPRPRLGEAHWTKVEDLYVEVTATVKLPGFDPITETVTIRMGSYARSGNDCTVTIGDKTYQNVDYTTDGELKLSHPDMPVRHMVVHHGERQYTIFKVFRGVWLTFGAWPESVKRVPEDLEPLTLEQSLAAFA